jgi:DNA-binding NarL/FixJ family response regulator
MNLSALLGPIENEHANCSSFQKIILWGQDDLFTQAIESFLETRKTLNVIRILSDQGEDQLVEQVKALHPAIVILYLANCAPDEQLPLHILQNQPDLKVVVVSGENNRVQVFHKQNLILREASDLLSILES